MDNLPRSRALVRLDGPGHIMPVEPVTPPGSRIWRTIHIPVMMAALAIALLAAGALAIHLVGVALRSAGLPGARYFGPPVGAAVVVAGYLTFVRIIERRRDVEELDPAGWLVELVAGLAGGLALSLAAFGVLGVAGAVRVAGANQPGVMLLPLDVQLCTAVILELIVCGLGFRLVERWLGSWLALMGVVTFFAIARLFTADPTPAAVAAVALEAGLLLAVLYMATRRLWGAIGLGAGWKISQIALYGAALSDGRPRGFLLTELDGPDWLTGGDAGADSSLAALLVNGLAMAVLVTVAVRRGRIVRPAWRRGRTARRQDA